MLEVVVHVNRAICLVRVRRCLPLINTALVNCKFCDRSLLDRGSTVSTATGFVYTGTVPLVSTPTNSISLDRLPNKFVTGDYIGDSYP